MLLIGLGHKARQGKNTVAVEMLNACPLDCAVHMLAFADGVRKETNTAIRQAGGVRELIEGWQTAGIMPEWVRAESYPAKQRTLLQWYGTDYRRGKDPDYWVKRMDQTLLDLLPDVAIITDVRFPNEAEYIRSRGGFNVQLIRTTPPDIVVPEHESEKALDGYRDWHYTIKAGNREELSRLALDVFGRILVRHGLTSTNDR